jgi:hypothetical protein
MQIIYDPAGTRYIALLEATYWSAFFGTPKIDAVGYLEESSQEEREITMAGYQGSHWLNLS